ncbi:UvrD-helicase domain-containing protein [Deinococcus soli (ex Cha et al. 2016)]|uniref:UvrD-helicase domain-containing protein n=1 Tax=Deinococcus soli (ex Cha et al. 2016) TaxID=1309411 RepID=UPI001662E27D|nr:UvrD-helicase domain-containing protein [Deinococcus soli (ex Cha et al. 2016)]GGB76522.1 hypothetical protein GCM10008019_35920 [Deinococcus soli (ex Cha et al. 2016)]
MTSEGADHIIVLAGAGTGKTHLLTHRYLEHLTRYSPLEVAAVTFTERAAAELRSRIRAQARTQQLSEHTIAEIDAAPIGTIHALAARICREHGELAGLPRNFMVMDALGSTQWRARHLPRAIAGLNSTVFEHMPYTRVMTILEVLLEEPYGTLRQFQAHTVAGVREQWKAQIEDHRLAVWTRLTTRPEWQRSREQLQAVSGKDGDRLEDLRRQVVQALGLPSDQCREAAAVLRSARPNVGSQKAWPDGDLQLTQGSIATLRDLVRAEKALNIEWNTQDDALVSALPALEEAFQHIHDQLFQWRVQQGRLDFADLEGGALRIMQHPRVQAFYQARFKAVLVDECQDTSPAQAQLLRALMGDATRMYVGDPLQSIYGFRTGSEPMHGSFLMEVQHLGGTSSELTHSYRAHMDLVAPLNKAMNHLMSGHHLELTAAREAPAGGNAMHFLEVPGEGRRGARLKAEATRVAQEIRALLDADTPVFDRQREAWRPVTPGDIAVLARTWRPLDTFQDALLAAGVPAFLAGGGDLLKTAPAQDAWMLLRAAGDPADDLATAAILRGPIFSWTDADLHALWKSRLPGEPWQAGLTRSAEPSHARARKFFQQLRALRLGPPVDTLILADRFGYRSFLAHLPAAARALADWDAILQLVTSLEDECPAPRAAAQRLRRLQASGFRLPRPPIAVAEAVTLASIHHAKGMEWPVVFVADLDGRNKPETEPAYVTDLGVIFSPDSFHQTKPGMLEYARYQKKRGADQELNRLLYVACTRARDRLYASGPAGSRAEAYTRLRASFEKAGAIISSRVSQ